MDPSGVGTKVAAWYRLEVAAGATVELRLRLAATGRGGDGAPALDDHAHGPGAPDLLGEGFEGVMAAREAEADAFYAELTPSDATPAEAHVLRRAAAGLIWGKQFYRYKVADWLDGDPIGPAPPGERLTGRNHAWRHVDAGDVISMPDAWEYPWFAAWDLAFHAVALADLDPAFAKDQLLLMCREWYMHPNGQLPAYEWSFGDVDPPVHAWAALRVYEIDGRRDRRFLARVFQKLLLNFTWWVNRKDPDGRNLFQGGFLGLDNIGIFDRSAPLPTGGTITQSDGTAWMAMYSLNLMRIALELATEDHVYEDVATKFFEHFLYIAGAMTNMGGEQMGLWDDRDEFYYDVLNMPGGRKIPLKVRSMVGLIPLFAVETLEPELMKELPEFTARLEWFLNYRPDLAGLVSRWNERRVGERRLLSLLRGHRMKALLHRMLDETEFLSDHGVRALSKIHEEKPYRFQTNGDTLEVSMPPGGLVSALDPVLQACGGLWIAQGSGDADRQTADAFGRLTVPPGDPRYTLRRVWITPAEASVPYSVAAAAPLMISM